MTKFYKLKGLMREKNVTQADLSKIVGCSEQALNAKLNGRSNFTIPEAQKIVEILGIQNPGEYFFKTNVPKMQQKNK